MVSASISDVLSLSIGRQNAGRISRIYSESPQSPNPRSTAECSKYTRFHRTRIPRFSPMFTLEEAAAAAVNEDALRKSVSTYRRSYSVPS